MSINNHFTKVVQIVGVVLYQTSSLPRTERPRGDVKIMGLVTSRNYSTVKPILYKRRRSR